MTTSTTPPLLTPLPPAPLPTDAEAVFDAKAGASLTAQAVMVGEVNTALAWQADSMTATAGSMTAAASSAAAAASSATAAAGSVVSAQAQVGLAVAQAGNAAASANSAQVAAAAAGSAAGLPSVVGHGGQALVVRKDEGGFELKALDQAIGDVLITTRTPDATYVLPDTIYAQGAYPELFGNVGTLAATNDAFNWVVTTTPSVFSSGVGTVQSMACGKDNLIIAVGGKSSAQSGDGIAIKSMDGGQTWSSVVGLNGLYPLQRICTDNVGGWVVSCNGQNYVYRSSDNGVTWVQSGAAPGLSSWPVSFLSAGDPGVFIYIYYDPNQYIYFYYRSLNGGASWSLVYSAPSYYPTSNPCSLGGGIWLSPTQFSADVSYYQTLFTYDNFTTVVMRDGITGAVSSAGVTAGRDPRNGGVMTSNDGGRSFKYHPTLTGAVLVDKSGVIYVVDSGYQTAGFIYKSYDGGENFYQVSKPSIVNPLSASVSCNTSDGVWVAAVGGVWYRATRLYNYDISTQFRTSPHKAPRGYKAYIKGKLQ
jgi:hypothetical protein